MSRKKPVPLRARVEALEKRLHGGQLWLKSQVGVGSTFTFTLPLITSQA